MYAINLPAPSLVQKPSGPNPFDVPILTTKTVHLMLVRLTISQSGFSSFTHVCLHWSNALTYVTLLIISSPHLRLSSPFFFLFTLILSKTHLSSSFFVVFSSSSPSQFASLPPSTACPHRRSLLWPGYKPTPGRLPAGVRSNSVHRAKGQADLCHFLHLQRAQCGLPGHQEWTAKKGESGGTSTVPDKHDRLSSIFSLRFEWLSIILR